MDLDLKIVICGVGGQGILFMARVLYEMARLLNRNVLGSETHGMSQRGGSVTSHVKIGNYHSPMVRKGTADLLFALRAEESYSNLNYLGEGGYLILNAPHDYALASPILDAIKPRQIKIIKRDATGSAMKLGNSLVSNLVLLSACTKEEFFPLPQEILMRAVKAVSPPRFIEGNIKAVEAGLSLG